MITLIAALDKNGVIGRDNAIPWNLKTDMAHFRANTLNKPIIMGRKTFLSLGKPLPKRLNIVLSRSLSTFQGAIAVNSTQRALEVAKAQCLRTQTDEIMIIGGAEIYTLFMPMADKLLLTHVNAEITGDAYFPAFNAEEWRVSNPEHIEKSENDEFSFEVKAYFRGAY
jgi:dihydrofolate reductase